MELVQPQSFDESLAKLGARSPVGALLDSAGWANVPVAIRERAFFSANVESVRFLDRALGTISDFLAGARDPDTGALKTGSRAAFVDQMQKFASAEGLGPLTPALKGTIQDITSRGRLGLVFDVQTKAADDYGNWKQGMDPVVLDEFPAQKFIRVRKVKKPRAYHQAALGEVRLKTDLAFWIGLNRDFGVPWGPWGYNSGCDVEDKDRASAEKQGLLHPGQKVKPVDRDFNQGLSASVRGMSDAAVAQLKNIFGPQIKISGGEISWQGAAQPISRKAASLAEALQQVDLDGNKPATAEKIIALLEEMREVNPARVEDHLASWDESSVPAGGMAAGAAYAEFAKDKITGYAQELLNLLPREMVDTLPKINWILDNDPSNGGSYDWLTQRLTLSTDDPASKSAAEIKSVVWHEMLHWVHFHGYPAYQTAVADLFKTRTTLPNGTMERIKPLPFYPASCLGQTDDWYDAYAGRRYSPPYDYPTAGFGMGVEVPTRYVELLLKHPDALATIYWNDPSQRAVLEVMLQAFFNR